MTRGETRKWSIRGRVHAFGWQGDCQTVAHGDQACGGSEYGVKDLDGSRF